MRAVRRGIAALILALALLAPAIAGAAVLGNLRLEESALGSPGVAPAGDRAVLERIIAEESVGATFDARQWLQQTMQKLLQAVAGWLEKVMGAKSAQTSVRVIFYVLLVVSALVVAWIVSLLVRRVRSTLERGDGGGAAGTGGAVIAAAEGLPDDALAFADAQAAVGRYRDAVRALFGGAARELVDRGVVPRTRTRTDGELLADVTAARPALRAPLATLAGAFEPAWYGHIDPGAAGYRAARGVYAAFMALLAGEAA